MNNRDGARGAAFRCVAGVGLRMWARSLIGPWVRQPIEVVQQYDDSLALPGG